MSGPPGFCGGTSGGVFSGRESGWGSFGSRDMCPCLLSHHSEKADPNKSVPPQWLELMKPRNIGKHPEGSPLLPRRKAEAVRANGRLCSNFLLSTPQIGSPATDDQRGAAPGDNADMEP